MKPQIHRINRRAFLAGTGAATLTLPLLPSWTARAQSQPPNLVVLYHGIGTRLDAWRPAQTGTGYTMPELLRPLEAHRDDMLIVSGVENRLLYRLEAGEISHAAAAHSLLTAAPMEGVIGADGRHTGIETIDGRPPVSPSIDQVIAEHISAPGQRRSVNLGVGPTQVGEYAVFWRELAAGNTEWVAHMSDPSEAFARVLGGLEPDAPVELGFRERLRQQSGSVLDAVTESYGRLERSVSAEDRMVLQAHATRIRELETVLGGTVQPPSAQCAPVTPAAQEEFWHFRVE
ncbi:MAG: DUF1552 domain-containing protein, partial [Myxococcota bacterium]